MSLSFSYTLHRLCGCLSLLLYTHIEFVFISSGVSLHKYASYGSTQHHCDATLKTLLLYHNIVRCLSTDSNIKYLTVETDITIPYYCALVAVAVVVADTTTALTLRELHSRGQRHGGEGLHLRLLLLVELRVQLPHPNARLVGGVQLPHEVAEVDAHAAVVVQSQLAPVELQLRI